MNEPQKRAILFGCLDLHRRLAEMESMLAQSLTASPFARYTNDLSPAECKAVRELFALIRAAMLAGLQGAGVPLEVPQRNVRWALHCGLAVMDIATTDLGPDRLSARGPLDGSARAQVGLLRQELAGLIGRADACLLAPQHVRSLVDPRSSWGGR